MPTAGVALEGTPNLAKHGAPAPVPWANLPTVKGDRMSAENLLNAVRTGRKDLIEMARAMLSTIESPRSHAGTAGRCIRSSERSSNGTSPLHDAFTGRFIMVLQDFISVQECREAYHAMERVGLRYVTDKEIFTATRRIAEAIDALRGAITARNLRTPAEREAIIKRG